MSEPTSGRKPPLGVYAIIERKEGQKAYWMKIGVAFPNRDGSISVLLDAYPAGAHKLQIREQREWERPGAPPGGNGAGEAHP
jgi:O-succinylbenzoate synthase